MDRKKYTINPVRAVCKKYSGLDQGFQGINDTCYGVCSAFYGNDVYSCDSCNRDCKDFIERRKYQKFGYGSCDQPLPFKPVIWEQTPHYLPMLLERGMEIDEAVDKCKEMCKKNSLRRECMENCIVDSYAVEENYSEKNTEGNIRSRAVSTNITISEEINSEISGSTSTEMSSTSSSSGSSGGTSSSNSSGSSGGTSSSNSSGSSFSWQSILISIGSIILLFLAWLFFKYLERRKTTTGSSNNSVNDAKST
jgi:uncharacterized membrane protein YgcG